MAPRRLDPKDLAADLPLAAILRASPQRDTVTIEHDGRRLLARAGEPLALSLLAAGVSTIARSVKFHRPRGASCLRGVCDGCLARVDGVPNVMSCRVPSREGSRVESQNAFPSAAIDLLRVTDWFFPKQFDHHHLMVEFGAAMNRTMQVFARRMAGLGTLPDHAVPVSPVERISCDVLVVGAGPAGLAASCELARGGLDVVLAEEERDVGGTLLDELAPMPGTNGGPVFGFALARALEAEARAAGVAMRCGASVVASFDNATLAMTDDHALRIEPRVRLFANGCHEIVGAFESNDVPGVFTARAAARALASGVTVGERVVVAGNAWPAEGLVRALESVGVRVEWLTEGSLAGADGRSRVRGARWKGVDPKPRALKCDALVTAFEPAPAYELLGQAGIAIEPDEARRCFAPRVEPSGATERRDVFAAGSVRASADAWGAIDLARPLDAGGAIADGRRVAQTILASFRDAERARAHTEARP